MEKKPGDSMWWKPFGQPFEELKAVSKERVKAVGTGLDDFMQAVAAQSADGVPPGSDFGLAELEEKLQRLKRKVSHVEWGPGEAALRARLRVTPDAHSRAGGARRQGGGGRGAALQGEGSPPGGVHEGERDAAPTASATPGPSPRDAPPKRPQP